VQEAKRVAKSTVIYLFGSVATKLISFLLLPVHTQYIAPAELGYYDLATTYILLISSVLFLDIWSGIMRFMFNHQKLEDRYSVIYSGLVLFFSSTALYALLFFGITLFFPVQYKVYVFLYGLIICVQNLYSYVSRALGYNVLFAASGALSTLINVGLNLLLLTVFHWDYRALYLSYISGILVQCLLLEGKVHLLTRFRRGMIQSSLVKQLFRFSLPLSVNSVCYWLLTGYNKVVISSMGTEFNGYFAVATKFSLVLNLLSSCFSMAWQELAFGKSGQDAGTAQFYSKATNLYVKFLFCGALGLIPLVNLAFPYLVDPQYQSALSIVPIYILATVAGILSTFLNSILTAYLKTTSIFYCTLFACLTNVATVHLLIGPLGVQAACISLLLGYLVGDGIGIYAIKKQIPFQFDTKCFLYMVPLLMGFIFVYNRYGAIANLFMTLLALGIAALLFRKYLAQIGRIFRRVRSSRKTNK